jgi:hypothetical protein
LRLSISSTSEMLKLVQGRLFGMLHHNKRRHSAHQNSSHIVQEPGSTFYLESDAGEKVSKLVAINGAPLARGEITQLDVHDARALKVTNVQAKRIAHAADLVLLALGENDFE